MRISDWSSDVCSSDLIGKQRAPRARRTEEGLARNPESEVVAGAAAVVDRTVESLADPGLNGAAGMDIVEAHVEQRRRLGGDHIGGGVADVDRGELQAGRREVRIAAVEGLAHQGILHARHVMQRIRSAEHTSELPSLMRL